MSAITEYIHYHQENYDNWGINRVGTSKSSTMSDAFSSMRNAMTNLDEMDKLMADAKQIENAYNDLFFPTQETDFSNALGDIVQQVLIEQFGAAAGRFDPTTLGVERSSLSVEYKTKVKAVRQKIDVANVAKDAKCK